MSIEYSDAQEVKNNKAMQIKNVQLCLEWREDFDKRQVNVLLSFS